MLFLMVRLTVTPTIHAAWQKYQELEDRDGLAADQEGEPGPGGNESKSADDNNLEVDGPVTHDHIIRISKTLRRAHPKDDSFRLSALLKGSNVYIEPPRPKPEPVRLHMTQIISRSNGCTDLLKTPEFKALMARLRREQEEWQYERMIAHKADQYQASIGATEKQTDEEEVTYADVNRQLTLILNVLISIIFCAVAIWLTAWHWSVPKRLFASMGGSVVVGIAEVTIYAGYIRRIKDAKVQERKKKEVREVTPLFRIKKEKNS